jgi:hypothetical protein
MTALPQPDWDAMRDGMKDWIAALNTLELSTRLGPRDLPVDVTPLMLAAERVGLTWWEWYGKDPDIPRRHRYRAGMEDTRDRWAAMFRDELTEWAAERRASAALGDALTRKDDET